MKLSKAIEVNEDLLGDGPYWPEEVRRQAVKLGIEALKGWKEARRRHGLFYFPLLPGETED